MNVNLFFNPNLVISKIRFAILILVLVCSVGLFSVEPSEAQYDTRDLVFNPSTLERLDPVYVNHVDGHSGESLQDPVVELDKSTYTWTDKVLITVTSPHHNLDSQVIEEIGNNPNGENVSSSITVATRGNDLRNYKLVETGADTGVFVGEVTLTGFSHDVNNIPGPDTNPRTSGIGPYDGKLETDNDDDIAVILKYHFGYNDKEPVSDTAEIKWNIGQVQRTETNNPADGASVIRVTDPDMNLDPDSIDNFRITVFSETDLVGIELTVTETGDATGIFEGSVSFSNQGTSGTSIQVLGRDTITAKYTDRTLPRPHSINDVIHVTDTTVINVDLPSSKTVPATVSIESSDISWTDKVYILIASPEHNRDPEVKDEIGATADNIVRIATRGHEIDQYKLVETGTDTATFKGEITLTGFSHDADGISGQDTNPRTGGNGPHDGMLATRYQEDAIRVTFTYGDVNSIDTALIRFNEGEAIWLESSYSINGTGIIRVTDADMDLTSAMDSFDIMVWSNTDRRGIDLTVTETNEATGIFEGTVFFTNMGQSVDNRLLVSVDDTITAGYSDYTLPSPHRLSDSRDITGTTRINNLQATVVPPITPTVTPVTATISLDKNSYTWTDKVRITITSPSHNVDSSAVEEIGHTAADAIKVSTAGHALTQYKLVETGADTGIFAGEVTLTGFTLDVDSNTGPDTNPRNGGNGPSGGKLEATQNDRLTVLFELGNNATVTESSVIRWNAGQVQWLERTYLTNGTGVLRITDADMNLSPETANSFDVDVTSNTDQSGIELTVTETGVATGIFEGRVTFAENQNSGNNKLRVTQGDTITAKYHDRTPMPEYRYTQTYINATTRITEHIETGIGGTGLPDNISLDKKVYTWTDKVRIMIVAPDHNVDSNVVDVIGNTAADAIKISTKQHSLNQYKLVETGKDTSIFEGEITLTGFLHDLDGTRGSETRPKTSDSNQTSFGPHNGMLETVHDDKLTVTFKFSADITVEKSSPIKWNKGQVKWLEKSYPISGPGKIQVTDADMNLSPETADSFDVVVRSDTDRRGINVTVTETGKETGIFEGKVLFSDIDESSGNKLQVTKRDKIIIDYEDRTLPKPSTTSDTKHITGNSIIEWSVSKKVLTGNLLELATITSTRIQDGTGEPIASITSGQKVKVIASVQNSQKNNQEFIYILRVQDDSGATVALSWVPGTMTPEQTLSPETSWTPKTAGRYTVTTYVWESMDNPIAIASHLVKTVTVN